MPELSKAIARLMEERERARPERPPDLPAVRAIVEQLRGSVAPMDRPPVEAFARQVLDDLGREVLASTDPAHLVALVRSAWRLAAEPGTDEPRIRIFEPELTGEGWGVACTVVQTLMRDRPFIVETVRETLLEAGCAIRALHHPVVAIERSAAGALLAVPPPGAPGQRESLVHAEVDRIADAAAVAQRLRDRLGALIAATDDQGAMLARAVDIAAALRQQRLPPPWRDFAAETAAFLQWLCQDTFVFIGYREYRLAGQGAQRTAAVRPGSGLGLLRDERRSRWAEPRPLDDDVRRLLHEPPLLVAAKTTAESPVHPRAHMDVIVVKEIDAGGIVVGEQRFLGLFTPKAYAEDPAAVPIVRQKLAAVLEASGAEPDSHDHRAIVAAFAEMPRVVLLASPVAALTEELSHLVAAATRNELAVHARPDTTGRGVFVSVLIPRARFSDELGRRVRATLASALGASGVLEERLRLDDSPQVRLYLHLAAAAGALRTYPAAELRRLVAGLLRTWDDRLRDTLGAGEPAGDAAVLAARYAEVLPEPYKTATDVARAARDIRHLEALRATRAPQAAFGSDPGDADRCTVTVYVPGPPLVLSDFLPVLENLGLRVLTEDTVQVRVPDVGPACIHTFRVQDARGAALDAGAVAPRLEPALLVLLAGRVDNDPLNALVVSADLSWRQVDLLRAYVRHGVQLGSAPSAATLTGALVAHPHVSRLLWEYFAARFDPTRGLTPRERLAGPLADLERQFHASLASVTSLVADRALRALFRQMAATLRTNFFDGGADGDGAPAIPIALKIDPRGLAPTPPPEPVAEIFVHGVRVNGVHLRAGPVARGGIRLSDRHDDFRREVLDLMRTQVVKNAVIVPTGAKGGFVVRRAPGTVPTAEQDEAAYRAYVLALLSVTDNVEQGRVAPAPGVLYDAADPYLVVAPDRGTAGFSDHANRLAADRGFWLGDAFASGGAHGYDHKKLGITARGVWTCIRRHFRELGRDPDNDPLAVIAIGSMAGDVCGNGLLLSRNLRVRAAFSEAHVFLDPDPEPAVAFAERERLFRLPHATWADYDPGRLSRGGGVYPRTAKAIDLSPEARAMLGLPDGTPSGEDVVRAILRMEADLLWNGGVGTYVKASDESHAAADDSANEAVRVDASELRVAVVAEGGNLGLTQRARVEFALRGGHVHTDAIDNSAGVDLSDHEVNLKLALGDAVARGELSLAERNQLLAELTPEVVARVLAHNERQALVLALDQLRSRTRLRDFRVLMTDLEAAGHLDRRRDALPDREALRRRRGAFLGLTRPELAVLLAHTKLALRAQLLASSVPDEPWAEAYLRAYFPERLRRHFGAAVRTHRLRREIIAVELVNALVDRMGTTFVSRVSHDLDVDAPAVVRAWAAAADAGGAPAVWDELSALTPPLPVAAEYRCWLALEEALERATRWLVTAGDLPGPAGTPLALSLVPPPADLARLVTTLPPRTLPGPLESLVQAGTPRALAERIDTLDRLTDALETNRLARDLGVPAERAAEAVARGAAVLDLDWLQRVAAGLPGDDPWERRAAALLLGDLARARRDLARALLGDDPADTTPLAERAAAWVAARRPAIDRLRALTDDVKSAPRPSLAALVVLAREIAAAVTAPAA